jgi:hypothetical protein
MSPALITSLLACIALPGATAPQPEAKPAPTPRRVHHIKVRGDADNSRLASDVARELQDTSAEGAELVILELGANSWRADVLLTIADAITASPAPVRLLFSDPKDRRVGSGVAVLGLVAPACYLDPDTTIASSPADDRRELAPKGADLDAARQRLIDLARPARQSRGADARLAEFLLAPTSAMWAVEATPGAPMLLSPSAPRSSGAGSTTHAARIASVEPGDTTPSISISLAAAAGLRLITAEAARPGDILVAEGIIARPLVTRTVESGLADAQARLSRGMNSIDATIEAIDRTLAVRVPDERSNTAPLYHRAGREALDLAAKARRMLAATERLTQDYPELLQTPAHDRTPVGEEGRDHARDWRTVFQERRDKLGAQEARARQYQAR